MLILKALIFFFIACVFEVGGGYLVWLWLKEGKSLIIGVIGLLALAGYGIIATFQTEGFGRVYASYGGFFIAFSMLWAMYFDNFNPDKYDIIGILIAIFGVCIIMFAPR